MSDHTEAKIRESSDNCDVGPDCRICRDVRPLLRLLDEARADRDALLCALEIIAGRRQCADSLMSNADVANAALTAMEENS